MTTKERMQSQKVYFCDDESLVVEQTACLEKLYDFNHTRPSGGGACRSIKGTFCRSR